jgi:RNA polymerase primary sigma factor
MTMMIATATHESRPRPTAAPARRRPTRPGLSRDEEVELAARVARGDRQARNDMAEANLGLVSTIARDFLDRGLELDDLIGEGHLGLLRAAERFDPSHGVRFSTYATHWIKEAIRKALINTAPTIRLPAHMIRTLTRWRRTERALARDLGRQAGFEEVAEALGLSRARRDVVARALESRRLCPRGRGDEGGAGVGALAEVADRRRDEQRLEAEEERAMVRR